MKAKYLEIIDQFISKIIECTEEANENVKKQNRESEQDKIVLNNKITELTRAITEARSKEEEAIEKYEIEKRKTEELEWIKKELSDFILGIATEQYLGQEVAAAKRVFNLNFSGLRKKRRNAYNYETKEAAKQAYIEKEKKEYQETEFLDWLFQPVE